MLRVLYVIFIKLYVYVLRMNIYSLQALYVLSILKQPRLQQEEGKKNQKEVLPSSFTFIQTKSFYFILFQNDSFYCHILFYNCSTGCFMGVHLVCIHCLMARCHAKSLKYTFIDNLPPLIYI